MTTREQSCRPQDRATAKCQRFDGSGGRHSSTAVSRTDTGILTRHVRLNAYHRKSEHRLTITIDRQNRAIERKMSNTRRRRNDELDCTAGKNTPPTKSTVRVTLEMRPDRMWSLEHLPTSLGRDSSMWSLEHLQTSLGRTALLDRCHRTIAVEAFTELQEC